MKKLLLILFVAGLFTPAFAEDEGVAITSREISIVAVTDSSDMYKGVVAIDDKRCMYVAGALTATSVEFGTTTLEPIGVASFIAKYDGTGVASWAVALQGATTVTAMVKEGDYLYVAGQFAGEAQLSSTDGNHVTINGMADETSQVSAFIAKYNAADGKLVASKTFIPENNADMVAKGYANYGGDAYFKIGKIEISDGKIYIGAAYTNNVSIDQVKLSSQFANVWGIGWYMALKSEVILAMTTDFTESVRVAEVYPTEIEGMNSVYAEDMNFTVSEGTVYAAFTGIGNLTFVTQNGSQPYEFLFDGMGTTEHGFGIAAIMTDETTFKTYNAPASSVSASYHTIGSMEAEGENIYMAGTFHSTLALSTDTAVGACDIYVATIDKNLEVQNIVTNANYEGETNAAYEVQTGMIVADGKVRVTGYVSDMSTGNALQPLTYSIYDGKSHLDGGSVIYSIDYSVGKISSLGIQGNKYVVNLYNAEWNTSAIDIATTDAAIDFIDGRFVFDKTIDAQIYDIFGRCVKVANDALSIDIDDLRNGCYILKTGKKAVKFIK